MPRAPGNYLNPREQQIMELVYQRGEVTASELQEALPGSPSNSTVRTLLRILEQRGHVLHEEQQGRFVYRASRERPSAAKSALEGVLKTFFHGSIENAFATLLTARETSLTPSELNRLTDIIEQARVNSTAETQNKR